MSDWTDAFFKAPASYRGEDGIVLNGDASSVLPDLPADSIDLVFTDPDWEKGKTVWYEVLARCCPRLMKDGAALITEVPQKFFPIMMVFHLWATPQGLTHRWTYHWDYCEGRHRRLRMGIEATWKPLLCYVKHKWPRRGFVRDGFKTAPALGHKKRHKWGKDFGGYCYYIEKHTDPGDIVLDPYVGGGTTAMACRKLGRRFVCIDISGKLCESIAKELKSDL